MPPVYRHFKPEEVVGLDPEFCSKLDLATEKTIALSEEHRRVPFVITSGFRSPEKNLSVIGAVPDSAHLKGLAVDLRIESSHEVWVMVAALTSVGINRIGVYVNKDWQPIHLHCDVDPEKVSQVLFVKSEGQPNSPIVAA